MSLRAKLLLVLMLAVLGIGGFYLRVLARRIFFEPPPQAEEAIRAKLSEVALQSATGVNQAATLYFPSLDDRKLVAEMRPIAWAQNDIDRIRQVLLGLIEGSRQGLDRSLPPSTSIRAVFLGSDGTAYVDFSNEVLVGFNPGIESEYLAVYSVVDSVAANVPAVKKIKFLIQGQEVDTLAGHADLTQVYSPDLTLLKTAP